MICKPSAKFKRISLIQPEKALLPIIPTFFAVDTSTRFVHPENTLLPSSVVPASPLSLNLTFARVVSFENALSLIFVMVPLRRRLTMEEHPANACFPISASFVILPRSTSATPSFLFIAFRFVQFIKALLSINVIFSEISKSVAKIFENA